MTQHLHDRIVPGCYRCDLGKDEEAATIAEQAADEAREAACPRHDWMEFGGPGDEWRQCFLCGKQEDA